RSARCSARRRWRLPDGARGPGALAPWGLACGGRRSARFARRVEACFVAPRGTSLVRARAERQRARGGDPARRECDRPRISRSIALSTAAERQCARRAPGEREWSLEHHMGAEVTARPDRNPGRRAERARQVRSQGQTAPFPQCHPTTSQPASPKRAERDLMRRCPKRTPPLPPHNNALYAALAAAARRSRGMRQARMPDSSTTWPARAIAVTAAAAAKASQRCVAPEK